MGLSEAIQSRGLVLFSFPTAGVQDQISVLLSQTGHLACFARATLMMTDGLLLFMTMTIMTMMILQ